ncbi:MAG TPA: helix-turn-helix transcriptional regulator [Pseudonocardiaceae bacterium]|nr:helix-turn-helix transcriptional regulator [Pseudonocardiaceae bacterium]
MADQQSNVNARSLGLELQRLRKERNIMAEDVADALGVSPSTFSRMENGTRVLTSEEVASICTVLRVKGVQRAELIDLARRQSGSGFMESHTTDEQSRSYLNFESTATKITNFELALVPGLAQTAEYAHAILSALRVGDSDENIEAWVGQRMSRQAILTRKLSPAFHWILTEEALRRPVGGPRVLARQIRHLVDLTENPNVSLNVVAAKVAAHPGLMGQFVVMEFASDPTIVFVEDRTTGIFLDDEAKVAPYMLTVEKLTDIALDERASKRLMQSIVRDVERE